MISDVCCLLSAFCCPLSHVCCALCAGYWLLAAGCWPLAAAAGCWLLLAGCWLMVLLVLLVLLAAGRWLLASLGRERGVVLLRWGPGDFGPGCIGHYLVPFWCHSSAAILGWTGHRFRGWAGQGLLVASMATL